ncbi:MAG TPA: 30S ribosomal protein S20 [Polyangiaceae bacterium]|nr:30S ribosomal protein S20 [Polyangiaceae bacterium]
MANHVSADKRNRQRLVRTARNRSLRTAVKNALKIARAALAAGDKTAAAEPVKKATSALARAVSKGILHQKTASRTISRVESALGKL